MSAAALIWLSALAATAAAGGAPAAEAPPGGAAAGRDPHAHVREILVRPLYQRWKLREERPEAPRAEAPPRRSWLLEKYERFAEWLWEKFGKWLNRRGPSVRRPGLGGFRGHLGWVGWGVVGALAVLLAVLLYRVLAARRAAGRAARVLGREQVRKALEAGEALALSGPEWLEEARRLGVGSEFRAAYRALYLALLSGLHAAGKIDFRRSRTNWTYVERFRGPEGQRGTFGALTALFDAVWYGRKLAEGTSWEEVRGQVSGLLAGGGTPGA